MPANNPFEPGLFSRLVSKPQKIVILRASRIGDFLCAYPALRALRQALPGAEISMITLPLLKDVTERSPYIDRFIAFPGYPGIAEQFFDARHATEFFAQMQLENFDLAIQMQGSGVYSNPFTLMLGARYTAGFIREGDGPGRLDAAVTWPQHEHEIRRNLALTSLLGATTVNEELEFPLQHEDCLEAEKLLQEAEPPLIGLHTSARDLTRRWFPESFIVTGRQLQQQYQGTLVLLGEAEDRAELDHLTAAFDGPVLNLAGKTSLVSLGAVLTHLAVLVTNDTGPAHIAYALNTPVVTIFGAGDPALNGPITPGPHRIMLHPVACRPCNLGTCPIGYQCLEGVTVTEVVKAASELFRNHYL
ncbi:MAG TPA: glycosyltransferase family 9 protein [Chloroflexia bacterium]|nr:glycosyltransferase family 9 protein [Chloroflexia bacterium]